MLLLQENFIAGQPCTRMEGRLQRCQSLFYAPKLLKSCQSKNMQQVQAQYKAVYDRMTSTKKDLLSNVQGVNSLVAIAVAKRASLYAHFLGIMAML